jgi:hypothetical protein
MYISHPLQHIHNNLLIPVFMCLFQFPLNNFLKHVFIIYRQNMVLGEQDCYIKAMYKNSSHAGARV